MTTPSTARKAGPFTGTGSQTAWPFTFKVFAAADVKVTATDANGDEVLLVLNTDYTVSLNANQETSPGGTVNYLLPSGRKLSIVGDLDYDQPLDLPSGGNYSPTALENQLDRTVMQIQQLAEESSRSVKVPVTSDYPLESLTADLIRIADSADNLDTVAENITSVNVVAADLSEPVSEINTVATSIANVNAVGNNISNVNTVAGISANVTTVAGIQANVTTVAGIAADVAAVAGNAADISAVADNETNIDAVAGNATNINAVAANETNIDTVAGIAADVTTVAGISADVSTVADNLTDVTNFADVYQGPKASDPTLRNNGSALQAGDLYFNTVDNALRAYSGSQWVAGTAGTINVQRFSGDGTDTTFTLASAPAGENNTQVFIGGVYQQKDTYSLSGSTITFSSAPPSGTDNIEVVTIATLALGETDASLVSYTPTGSGAVERTVQSKLREAVSTKDFGAVGDGVADDTAALQAAINYAIASKLPLRGGGLSYKITAPLVLGGTAPSANGLHFIGENCTIVQVTAGQNGITINGRSEIVVERVNVQLPTDTTGSGGSGLLFAGTSGWNRIRNCVFTGGRHGIYNNNTGIFATVIEECRFFNQYGSHFRWIAGGLATTISLRNCTGDTVLSTEPAFYVANPGTGSGIENLEITMCSADNCVQALQVESRYLFVNNFYVERTRGAEWQSGFSVFNFPATYEPAFIHGLRCTFASAVPAGLSNICALRIDGQVVNSVRLAGDFTASPGNTTIISGTRTAQLHGASNFVTGASYGIKTSGLVFGTDNGASALTIDPASGGNVVKLSDLATVRCAGDGTGNSTGQAGIAFGIANYAVPPGVISNGTFTAPAYVYSAILPYSPGGGVGRRGGLKAFVNPSSGGLTTPINCATWDFNGHYLAGADNTYDIGSAAFRWKTIYAATGTINTSDGNQKQQVADLTEAERQVATAIKGLIKTFKFNDSVEAKGDKARIHVGVVAQDVKKAFADAGLDADRYALFCKDVWHTHNGQVVEVNADGKYIERRWELNGEAIEPDAEGNIPEGAVTVETQHDTEQHERLGIRYDQLLAFVIVAL